MFRTRVIVLLASVLLATVFYLLDVYPLGIYLGLLGFVVAYTAVSMVLGPLLGTDKFFVSQSAPTSPAPATSIEQPQWDERSISRIAVDIVHARFDGFQELTLEIPKANFTADDEALVVATLKAAIADDERFVGVEVQSVPSHFRDTIVLLLSW